MADQTAAIEVSLVPSAHRHGSGWWGMMTLIATEGALFIYLLFSYYFIAAQTPTSWPPGGPLDIKISLINTFVLLASSYTLVLADRAQGRGTSPILWLAATILLGATFVGIQISEWTDKSFTPSSDSFGSLYYIVTGFHLVHVTVGLLMLAVVLVWTKWFDPQPRPLQLRLAGYYWHFVDAVWLAVFFSFFIFPLLI